MNAYVAQWTETLTAEEIIGILDKAGIPAAKVLSVHEFLQLDQVAYNRQVINVPYGDLGDIPMQGFPVSFSSMPEQLFRGAPTLGEHNYEVYGQLGYTKEQLDKMKEAHEI